jgi:hypothetical protein
MLRSNLDLAPRARLTTFAALALVASVVLAACSSADDTASKGTAPTISNLTFKTNTLTVGKTDVVEGTLDFADPDGDFDGVEGQASIGGQTTSIPRNSTASTQTQGSVILQLALGASQKGTIDVEFWGVDKNGNKSNHEKAAFDVQ